MSIVTKCTASAMTFKILEIETNYKLTRVNNPYRIKIEMT